MVGIEIAVVVALWQAFDRDQLTYSGSLFRDAQDVAVD